VTTQPSTGGATGDVLTTTPVVKLLDASGNVVTGYAATTMTASLISAANGLAPTGTARQEVVASTASVNTASGVADFGTMRVIGVPDDNYKLSFTLPTGVSSSLTTESEEFDLVHAAPASVKVVANRAPIAGQQSGERFTQAPWVEILDEYGNRVTNHSPTFMVASISTTIACKQRAGLMEGAS
jgi:hypothetical protein